MGTAIPTTDALSVVGGNPESGKILLPQAEIGSHRTAKSAPYPGAQEGIKAHTNDAGKNGTNKKPVIMRQRLTYAR